MLESEDSINLLGSVIANVNNIFLIGIFLSRIYKRPKIEYWLGLLFILSIIPLILMFVKSFEIKRALLYYIQLILMISFIILELLLDYLLKIDFRNNKNILIPYVTLFYASLGGMVGIAGLSGKLWILVTVITFLSVTALSLFTHIRTNN